MSAAGGGDSGGTEADDIEIGPTRARGSSRPNDFARSGSALAVVDFGGSFVRDALSALTLGGRLAKTGMANHKGVVYYQFAKGVPFTACNGILGGPVLQVIPQKRRTKGMVGTVTAFEVNLFDFPDVGLEKVLEPHDTGLSFPLHVFVLARKNPSSGGIVSVGGGAPGVGDDASPRSGYSVLLKQTSTVVLGVVQQQDAVQWTIEIRNMVKSLQNAVKVRVDLRTRPLQDVVRDQMATAVSSASLSQRLEDDSAAAGGGGGGGGFQPDPHALQNVTQLQRNVALMDLRRPVPGSAGLQRRHPRLSARRSTVHSFWGARSSTSSSLMDDALLDGSSGGGGGGSGGGGEVDGEGGGVRGVDDQSRRVAKHFRARDHRGVYYFFWGRIRVR